MELNEIRELFPYLKQGKIYFNHASIGPLPLNVKEIIERYSVERSEGTINNYKQFLLVETRARKKIAQLLNAPPQNITWSTNVGTAMSMLAQGLDWQTGDEIILNNIEFPSNVYPFLNLQSKGVKVKFVKAKNGILNLEDIEKEITERTKLISVSLVQFLSGFQIDLKSLSEICRKHGIILSVDAIQAAGNVKIDLTETNVDFLAGGTQKWLLGLQGLAYVYVGNELLEKLNPTILGWQSVANPWELLNYDLTFPDDARKFLSGTLNALGIFAFNKSLEIFLNFGFENVYSQVKNNTNFLLEKSQEIGLKPLTAGLPQCNQSAIVTFKVENATQIKEELGKKNIIVEIREGMIRVSPHFYNTRQEIERFTEELELLLTGSGF